MMTFLFMDEHGGPCKKVEEEALSVAQVEATLIWACRVAMNGVLDYESRTGDYIPARPRPAF